jgi:hypothetical protein
MKNKPLKLNLAKQRLIDTVDDPFSELSVIYRLEVGPVKLEPNRLIAPYKVIQNEREEATELIYSYEESVFDPDESESQNLASMIAAQVALNYGLFCNSIIFHGVFDDADRQFLRDMAQNTACEIYVKKFLEPNPFLLGDAAKLPVIKKEHYLHAKLVFPDQPSPESGEQFASWKTDPGRYTILSSGGKDSLLSFGLMQELGYEAHPIFGNESGRHWFTALNAYRYFSENIPHTARVWMNSDRVFSWMLRHFPFIRQDFANVRSDEYPIRLWTVAVFLFGVLPLMRKRGIANLIIGDEYDTTDRREFQGITHYNGLYDQSRYFDDALTEYFRLKDWNIHQFSLLRTLSEMLIETILVQRYPDLQSHQVSCHAAHKEGERVHPCGKCEKCRRIVGMLKAIDADPARCGYSPEQIDNCLKELAQKGVHQELEGSRQLLWMLLDKNLIELPETVKASVKPHPEVLKLRFHPENSPFEIIPETIRPGIYRVFLEHSDGALRYTNGELIDFDLSQKPFR